MVSLSKGQKISLDKNMDLCLVGLGWDPAKYKGQEPFDLDASVFLLGADGKVTNDGDFVFYGAPIHASGSVRSLGDDRTGANSAEGDDEKIIMNLARIPASIQKIVIVVTIDSAEERGQNFGQVTNAYVRVVKIKKESDEEGDEVVRYELDEEFSDENAVMACEISRNGSEWKFGALGMGYNCGLEGFCRKFGIDLG